MRFSYVTAAVLPVAFATPFALERRGDNAAAILKDYQTLQKDIVALNTTLNGIPVSSAPTSKQESALISGTNAITKEIKAITSLASASTPFTVSESESIYNYINNTIQASTISLLQNFINHHPGFTKASLDPTVKSDLTSQKGLVSKQSSALTAKSQQPYKGEAPALTNNILNAFTNAINAYS